MNYRLVDASVLYFLSWRMFFELYKHVLSFNSAALVYRNWIIQGCVSSLPCPHFRVVFWICARQTSFRTKPSRLWKKMCSSYSFILLRLSITCRFLKLNRQMRFSLPSIKCLAAPPGFRLLPSTVSLTELCSTIWLQPARQYSEVGRSSRDLIDGSEKRTCRFS